MGYLVTTDEQMLVSAVRYALGRQTYIVMSTTKAVRTGWSQLSHGARGVILRDIDDELTRSAAAGTTVGMDMDHREWERLRDDIKSGTILNPIGSASDDELGPDQGYPSEEELQRLASFRGTARELVEYVESIWRNSAGTIVQHDTDNWGREVVIVTFITGGWSGCETIIGVLNRTLALMYKSEWRRGGSHSYSFPARVFHSDKAWNWEMLLHDPPSNDGPYAEVRDRLATLEAAVDERVHELAAEGSDFRAPAPGDLWALRTERDPDENVYCFNGSYYVAEQHTNFWPDQYEADEESIASGRLLFRSSS